MEEIARILKPGGLAILTVDMSMWFELNRPLDLVWDSGLCLVMPIDLRWPRQRFGIFSDSKLPADVLGLTLLKDDYVVETHYRQEGNPIDCLPGYRVPSLMPATVTRNRPPWWRLASMVYHWLFRGAPDRGRAGAD
jgi:hypothetical protein